MTLYLIESQEDDLDDYDINTSSIIGIASSLDKANKMIENWADQKMDFYVDLEEVDSDAAKWLCDRAYKGIDRYGHKWTIDIWITEEELDKGLERG